MIDFSPFPTEPQFETQQESIRQFAEESQRYLDDVLRQMREQFSRNLNQMIEQETNRAQHSRQTFRAPSPSGPMPLSALMPSALTNIINQAFRYGTPDRQDFLRAGYFGAGRLFEKWWMNQPGGGYPSRFKQSGDTPFDLFATLWRNDRNV